PLGLSHQLREKSDCRATRTTVVESWLLPTERVRSMAGAGVAARAEIASRCRPLRIGNVLVYRDFPSSEELDDAEFRWQGLQARRMRPEHRQHPTQRLGIAAGEETRRRRRTCGAQVAGIEQAAPLARLGHAVVANSTRRGHQLAQQRLEEGVMGAAQDQGVAA